jgi:hypothetical protein
VGGDVLIEEYSEWSFGTKQFRDFVDEYNDILILLSKREDNKSYWNLTCAAMDWMDLATEHLEVSHIDQIDWHRHSLQIYMHISCIDIVWESIKQLHKIYIEETNVPFKGDRSIFQGTKLNFDDNEYFKHIRATFGAHPVDVRRRRDKTETIRYYASWPTSGIYNEYDYAVTLYSERKGLKDEVFGFKVDQLMKFFESRYQYLEMIEQAIKKRVDEHYDRLRLIEIERSDDMLEQLQILKDENTQRLNSYYYDEIIHCMSHFFETKTGLKDTEVIRKFTDIMIKGVEEIYEKISNMVHDELHIEPFLKPNYPQWRYFGYDYGKLAETVMTNSGRKPFLIQSITTPLEKYIAFDYTSNDELYWLTVIALNIKNGSL